MEFYSTEQLPTLMKLTLFILLTTVIQISTQSRSFKMNGSTLVWGESRMMERTGIGVPLLAYKTTLIHLKVKNAETVSMISKSI